MKGLNPVAGWAGLVFLAEVGEEVTKILQLLLESPFVDARNLEIDRLCKIGANEKGLPNPSATCDGDHFSLWRMERSFKDALFRDSSDALLHDGRFIFGGIYNKDSDSAKYKTKIGLELD
jgi:hypothetical protein